MNRINEFKDSKVDSPEFFKENFTCPHCNVIAAQQWENKDIFSQRILVYVHTLLSNYRQNNNIFDTDEQKALENFKHYLNRNIKTIEFENKNITWSTCVSCKRPSIWVDEKMVYPFVSNVPLACEDMPEDVKAIYDEARSIANLSPRATAALLRVALEKLTLHLGEETGNLNTRISNLQKQGLPERVIKSLDIVRITANEGGAPAGQIDLENKDNADIVHSLFNLINFIVEKTITENKQIDTMFNKLPEDKKRGIENRDNN